MGSGSYSFAAYSCLANEREYSTKSADAVFKNRSLSAKSDIKLSNINARTYNTQIKPEMVDTGVRESRDSNEHPETTPIIIALDVTGSMRRTPHEMIKDNFPKLMDALMQLGVKDPQLLFMAVGDHVYVIRPYITRHGNGPIPSTKPVREVNDPNNKFNEFQKTLRAVEFDVNLFQHSLLVDSTFIPHHYTHRRVLVITHRDEITSQFNDELLSGDWEEQFNSIRTSYYDKLTV